MNVSLQDILYWSFVGVIAFQLLYWLAMVARFVFSKHKFIGHHPPKVSVIIAARDEAKRLRKFIPKVMAQKAVEFEVIVVDDCSYDDTLDVLLDFQKVYPNFRFTQLRESSDFLGGKKYALTLGVKSAKYEHLVFIDADCYPQTEYWLREMALAVEARPMILGIGLYERGKGFLNRLIRTEAAAIALQYMSFAKSGLPYMGVGRNMAYHSDLFFDNKGFASHYHLKSGDDDLFVNEVANRKNTKGVFCHEAITLSEPKRKWTDWLRQKQRHFTTAKKYRLIHKILLGSLSLSQYLLFGVLIANLVTAVHWQDVLILFGIRFLIQHLLFGVFLWKVGQKGLIFWIAIVEVLLLILYPVIVLRGVAEKANAWKRI